MEDRSTGTFGKCHRKLAKTSFRVDEELETETIVAAIDANAHYLLTAPFLLCILVSHLSSQIFLICSHLCCVRQCRLLGAKTSLSLDLMLRKQSVSAYKARLQQGEGIEYVSVPWLPVLPHAEHIEHTVELPEITEHSSGAVSPSVAPRFVADESSGECKVQ